MSSHTTQRYFYGSWWNPLVLSPDEARKSDPRVAAMVVPIVCDRCGAVKRDDTGRTLMTSLKWRLTRRMVCPTCFEAEKTMEALDTVVNWDSDEVLF